MKNPTHRISKTILLLFSMSLAGVTCALGYPPDNAAVLYYKAVGLYRGDAEMESALTNLRKGSIEVNDEIREAVRNNREALITLLDACEVKKCDWGINYARGFELMPPRYATLKQLATLVVAEAKILVRDGDYRTGLERCLSLHKMASHINDRLFISYLVGVAINGMAHDCTTEILSAMPPDAATLNWFRSELMQITDLPLPIGPALDGERQAGTVSLNADRMARVAEVQFGDEPFQKIVLDRVAAGDEAFFTANRIAWIQYWDEVVAAFDLPYPQAYTQLERLHEEFTSKSDAVLIEQLAPACGAICTQWTRSKAQYRAIRIALDLYLAQAETRRLPATLPAEAPTDPFSGKPFEYEQTSTGFVLHCQGQDLNKNATCEYTFAVAK